MKSMLMALSLFWSGLLAVADTALPVSVHGGRLTGVSKAEMVRMRNIDQWLLKSPTLSAAKPDDPACVEEVRPQAGRVFLVVEMEMQPGFSISRWDYQILASGQPYRCLAVANDGAPFDELIAKVGPGGRVRMLFDLPESARGPELVLTEKFRAIRQQKPIALPVPGMETTAAPPSPVAPPEGAPPPGPSAPEAGAAPVAPEAPAAKPPPGAPPVPEAGQ